MLSKLVFQSAHNTEMNLIWSIDTYNDYFDPRGLPFQLPFEYW